MKNNLLFQILALSLTLILTISCSVKPKGTFSNANTPAAPDYTQLDYWAAHPEKEDPADAIPEAIGEEANPGDVDVFFLHPTIYTGKLGENQWNGPVDDPEFNERVDEGTIRFQASIFNEVGRVYAPRYRQAHLNAYYTKKEASAEKAFALAYADVKAAFEQFLEWRKPGTPIILAAHSQGTTHSIQLIKDYFDGTELQQYLIAAYIPGIGMRKDEFENIPLCASPEDFGCFCTWRTWKEGKQPKQWVSSKAEVTNPINWSITTEPASEEQHDGAILRDFNELIPELTSTQINQDLGILWTTKPDIRGVAFLRGNYHIVDFNLYYLDVRSNAADRAESYLEGKR